MADRDIRKEVTDRIVAALEQGTLPWRRSWKDGERALGLPTNAVSGRSYGGGNRMILLAAGMDASYQDNRWLTFRQAQGLGGGVKKGEHGIPIEYWETVPFWKRSGVELEHDGKLVKLGKAPTTDKQKTVTLADGREVETKDVTVSFEGKRHTWRQAESMLSTLIGKSHVVFNVEQCRGLDIEPVKRAPDPEYGKAHKIVEGMQNDGLLVNHGGDHAFYSPGRDSVTMPHQEQFESPEKYLGTLLHELGHATGHADRNNRQLGGMFGSSDYAREELVAELTSVFVAAETGIGFDDQDHASYIGAWLEKLGEDKHEIFRAASMASKAADYLIERGREVEQELSKGKEQEAPEIRDQLQPGIDLANSEVIPEAEAAALKHQALYGRDPATEPASRKSRSQRQTQSTDMER
ncbi:zincin-like metallopeptidase domain-containing protein [Rhodocyclaceae bacterium]